MSSLAIRCFTFAKPSPTPMPRALRAAAAANPWAPRAVPTAAEDPLVQDDADEVDDAGEPMEAPEESLFESEDEAGDGQAEQDAIERAELDGEDARYIEDGADEEEEEQDDAVDATLLTADAPASGSAKRGPADCQDAAKISTGVNGGAQPPQSAGSAAPAAAQKAPKKKAKVADFVMRHVESRSATARHRCSSGGEPGHGLLEGRQCAQLVLTASGAAKVPPPGRPKVVWLSLFRSFPMRHSRSWCSSSWTLLPLVGA